MSDLTTMAAGSTMGFVFRFLSESRKAKDAAFLQSLQLSKANTESANEASKRGGSFGSWIRRFIVIIVMVGLVILPFAAALVDVPTIIESEKGGKSFLFGLFKTQPQIVYQQVQGFLLIEQLRSAVLAIISFYFGAATAK